MLHCVTTFMSSNGRGGASPWVSDGGASLLPLPHVDGAGPISKSRVAPAARSAWRSYARAYERPFSFSDCT